MIIGDHVICMSKFTGQLFAVDKNTGRKKWTLPLLRGYEILGHLDGAILLSACNAIYSVDSESGKLNWAREISPNWLDSFQLPRAQMIGSSVYYGTKTSLYRLNAKNGVLQESGGWEMGTEVPMTFHIAGEDLFVLSDLPWKNLVREKRLLDKIRITKRKPNITAKNGCQIFWFNGLLVCVKDAKVLWTRFTTINPEYQSRSYDKGDFFQISRGSLAEHDFKTGKLLNMQFPHRRIKIELAAKENK